MPPEFTPETYGKPILPETQGGETEEYSMWRHYGTPIQVGYSVLITGGEATPSPGTVSPTNGDCNAADTGSGEGGLAWFRGGITYTVSDAEETILVAAGYTMDGESS